MHYRIYICQLPASNVLYKLAHFLPRDAMVTRHIGYRYPYGLAPSVRQCVRHKSLCYQNNRICYHAINAARQRNDSIVSCAKYIRDI